MQKRANTTYLAHGAALDIRQPYKLLCFSANLVRVWAARHSNAPHQPRDTRHGSLTRCRDAANTCLAHSTRTGTFSHPRNDKAPN